MKSIIVYRKSLLSFCYIHIYMAIVIAIVWYGTMDLMDTNISSEYKGKLGVAVILGYGVLLKLLFDFIVFFIKPWAITIDLESGVAHVGSKAIDLNKLKSMEINYCRFGVTELVFTENTMMSMPWHSGSFYRTNNWQKKLRTLHRKRKAYGIVFNRVKRFDD